MITGLCLNPCVDRTVQVASFRLGATNRVLSEERVASGKGINIALVAQRLGMKAAAIGLLPLENAALHIERLAQHGVEHAFVRTEGAVRVNLKIFDRQAQAVTELNEAGSQAQSSSFDQVLALALTHAAKSDYMVLTGSLPPGCPPDIYHQVMRRGAPACRMVLDVGGDRLREGAALHPFMLKPNIEELEQAAGRSLPSLEEIKAEAMKLADLGVPLVAVSMGAEGAMITDGSRAYYAPKVEVPVHSTVCAGDSMVVGMLMAQRNGADLQETLRSGVACATATVANHDDGLATRALYDQMLPRVTVQAI